MGNFNTNVPKPINLGNLLNPVRGVSPAAVNAPNPIPVAPTQPLAPAKPAVPVQPAAPIQPAVPIQPPVNSNPVNASPLAQGNVYNPGSIRQILQNQFNKALAPAPVAPAPVAHVAPAPAPATNSLVGTPYPGHASNVTDAQRTAWNNANAPGLVPGSMQWSAKTGIPPY